MALSYVIDHADQRVIVRMAGTFSNQEIDACYARLFADAQFVPGFDLLLDLRAPQVGSWSRLEELPYIGPITSLHLAKNLGGRCAKEDRHLVRLAAHLGFNSAHELCGNLADWTGDPPQVVDYVLWRCAATQDLAIFT